MTPVDKMEDDGTIAGSQVKQEPREADDTKESEADSQADTAKSGVEPATQIKTEPVTPVKIKTEVMTPAKSDLAAAGTTEAAGNAKIVPKTEAAGDTTGVKTEADSVLGLDVLVDDTMINDLDADLINQGKSGSGTTDGKPKDEKQPETEDAKVKPASAEDGVTKEEKTTTEEDKGDKKAETKADEKKPDGDDKSKRLVGFVCSLSLDSSVDCHVG